MPKTFTTKKQTTAPDAVKVEVLDRAILEIIGSERFLLNQTNRPARHKEALETIDESKLDEVPSLAEAIATVRLAEQQRLTWGTYECPLHGLELTRARARFRFVKVDNILYQRTEYVCIKSSPVWKKGDTIILGHAGEVVSAVYAKR